ncbi:MAG: GTPase HflX [candidate division Zixibacteria bacterium]|nr:GTPase HflX [candidate division Zixibacteria bacterium]
MARIEFDKKDYQKAIIGAVILDGARSFNGADPLEELRALANTAGAEIVGEVVQNRQRPDSAYYFGAGKVDEIRGMVSELNADLFIFDDDLAPAQVRNLEESLQIPVVDRSGLILDIFALHARTVEARTQVKLAQLKYLLPRLAGRWSHLERQEGAIGTRGPGETQLETDRRLIQKQIIDLERKLEDIDRERENQRKKRDSLFKITLVGYTNAGKSTILNLLTEAGVLVENKLFATLDSTTRRLDLGHGETALLTDTVGFISKLPAHLIASFRSTLLDVNNADLLLHVIDASDPDLEMQILTVNEELNRMESSGKNRVMIFNKIDLIDDPEQYQSLRVRYPDAYFVSARETTGISELMSKIINEFGKSRMEVIIRLGENEQGIYPELARNCRILETGSKGSDVIIRLAGSRSAVEKIINNNPQIRYTTVA